MENYARNGNRNLRIGNGVSYVMSLPYGDGEPREGGGGGGGGGGETRTIYMCGQTGYYSLLVHAHTLLGRPMRPALDRAKPYPPGLFFTQFYSVSRSDVCSYAWLCAHDRENIYSLSCELDGKSHTLCCLVWKL